MKEKKEEIIKDIRKHGKDTGSAEVQIALLTERITGLTEHFKKQKKELLHTLHEIEVKIKSNERLNKIYAFLIIEIEKFKAQLELLEQKYESGMESVKGTFEKGKQEFNQFIDTLKSKYTKKKKETRWEHFQSEISEAFSHLKDAFVLPQH